MAIEQKMLWDVTSRSNSSLDLMDSYGGMIAGCVSLPKEVHKALYFRVYTNKGYPVPVDYADLKLLIQGIGGKQIEGLHEEGVTIEFDATTKNIGGILSITGMFNEYCPYDSAVTKGEVMDHLLPHGLDTFEWKGTKDLAHNATMDLIKLPGLAHTVKGGHALIDSRGSVLILPEIMKSRGVMASVSVNGTFTEDTLLPLMYQIKVNGEVVQSVSSIANGMSLDWATTNLMLSTNGIRDDLSVAGFTIELVNPNPQQLTVTDVKLNVQSIINPDYVITD